MHKVEIYWQDLTEKKQKEILDEFNETEEFANWDVIPMAILEVEEDEKREFGVALTIRCEFKVEAESFEEAEKKANNYVANYDFGRLRDIDWDVDYIVDENGENMKL